jgi:hypothetical protein
MLFSNNLNLNKMDSDDDGFAKQGGEALDLGEDFDSEEEEDDPAPPQRKPMPQTKNVSSGVPQRKPEIKNDGAKGAQVKG